MMSVDPEVQLRNALRRAVRHDAGVRAGADVDDYRGVTPGGVLVYGDISAGDAEEVVAFGRSQVAPEGAGFAVTPRTVYDIASLTKPIAAAGAMLRLAESRVDIDAPVAPLVPELSGPGTRDITLRHLLGHASGLPAHVKLFERLRRGERCGAASRREALLRMATATPLAFEPGSQAVYSDLGYMVLGLAIERATGQRLDAVARALVTGPLQMRDTHFVDLDAEPAGRPPWADDAIAETAGGAGGRVAPTEVCPYRGLVVGEVHDDNAHAGGGVFGHAGLFSTAPDVARFARAIAAALAGHAGDGQPFSPDVVQRFAETTAAPGTTWRLGWDSPSPPGTTSHVGDSWPRWGPHGERGSIGHLGFTGCGMWIDCQSGRYAVLLTNRVHPSRDNLGIRGLRRTVTDAVWRLLSRRCR